MAKAQSISRSGPALALSGGGFRATLFHCGVLMRLNDLGYLSKLARISSVSGGSIANGMLAASWHRLDFQDGVATNLYGEVVEPLRSFCRRRIDIGALSAGFLVPGKTAGDFLADALDDFYGGVSLQDLPIGPVFTFNATNTQTGNLFRMRKDYCADYEVGQLVNYDLKLAVAVAASSAFPPVLSPVEIDVDVDDWTDFDGDERKKAKYFSKPHFKRKLVLTDGGVYDNLGLENIDGQGFNPVIVSDAGAPFDDDELTTPLWSRQALRVLDIMQNQTRALRKRALFSRLETRKVAYAGIDNLPSEFKVSQILKTGPNTQELANKRTRLNPFSEEEQGELINWGWLIMDLAMRTYVLPGTPPPRAYPIPGHRPG